MVRYLLLLGIAVALLVIGSAPASLPLITGDGRRSHQCSQ